MPADDPTPELERILRRVENHRLPEKAGEWANGALDTVESIQNTISSMAERGLDVPTDAQANALEKIYIGACRWLHIEPELG